MNATKTSTAINAFPMINGEVRRMSGEKYQIGDTGYIAEINKNTERVRIAWDGPATADGKKRLSTWVKLSIIELM